MDQYAYKMAPTPPHHPHTLNGGACAGPQAAVSTGIHGIFPPCPWSLYSYSPSPPAGHKPRATGKGPGVHTPNLLQSPVEAGTGLGSYKVRGTSLHTGMPMVTCLQSSPTFTHLPHGALFLRSILSRLDCTTVLTPASPRVTHP